jgi:hypothetical protein
MSDLIKDTQFLTALQQRILTNIQENNPPDHGIDREELQRGIKILRSDRKSSISSKASSTRAKSAKEPIDLATLMSTPTSK